MNDKPTVFPVPKIIPCPYCGETAYLGSFDEGVGCAHYCCTTNKIVEVGAVHSVRVTTCHQFEATWDGTQWVPVDERPNSTSRACERVSLLSGNWHGYDNISFMGDSDEV